MSGGVDSGVAAALLVKQGYSCTGFHMHLWAEAESKAENKCCSTESLLAARKTARQLGMDFHLVNFEKVFKKKVVDYFVKAYAAGLTPNPCVICNKLIKFGCLFDYAQGAGFDYLATGHYARTKAGWLLMAKDKAKDQTYFLYNLNKEQLAHVLFPVGDYLKKQVWQMAKKWRLAVAKRPESQEICFFPESDYRPFLRRQLGKMKPGAVVDTKGQIIGHHQGLPLYTIGQRRGFEVKLKKTIPPFYVVAKDIKKNQLVVGFGKETERKNFKVEKANWITQPLKTGDKCRVRIRHQGELLASKIQYLNSELRIILSKPDRGIASGQAVVFYKQKEVLGGGIIAKI